MCLSVVQEQYDSPSTFIMDGWKEFAGTSSKPQFSMMDLHGAKEVPVDRWIKADTSVKVRADDGKMYESGFHVWKEEDPKIKSYRRVFVRRVSASGTQSGKPIVIAQEMYIPSNQNDWPPKLGEPEKKETVFDKVKSSLKAGNA